MSDSLREQSPILLTKMIATTVPEESYSKQDSGVEEEIRLQPALIAATEENDDKTVYNDDTVDTQHPAVRSYESV